MKIEINFKNRNFLIKKIKIKAFYVSVDAVRRYICNIANTSLIDILKVNKTR